MARTITVDGTRYLIRGPETAARLREQYWAFVRKYRTDERWPLKRWLVERGKVYCRAARG